MKRARRSAEAARSSVLRRRFSGPIVRSSEFCKNLEPREDKHIGFGAGKIGGESGKQGSLSV
jgi:hypothetical protein